MSSDPQARREVEAEVADWLREREAERAKRDEEAEMAFYERLGEAWCCPCCEPHLA